MNDQVRLEIWPLAADGIAMHERKAIKLRYPARCSTCSVSLPAGALAVWDRKARAATCRSCEPAAAPAPDEHARARPSAGASARNEAGRRRRSSENRIRSAHPRLGGLIVALSAELPSTAAWARGAEGERRVGAGLDRLLAAGVGVLHDRGRPGTRANIDHLVVAASGIWIVDAKNYNGRVEKRNVGGWLSTDVRLFVGGRDRTQLLDGLISQRAAIDQALRGTDVTDVPVHTVLCFVGGNWKFFAKPFELQTSLVTWPNALYERITAGGPVGPRRQHELLAALERNLPPCA